MHPVIHCPASLRLSCSCNMVWKHCTPDNSQAIHRTITCQTTCQTNMNFDILQSCDSVVGTSTFGRLACFSLSNASTWNININVIDLIGNQPIQCQCGTRRVSSYFYESDPCNPYYLKPMRCVASGTCQRHYSLSYVMLGPRTNLLPECAPIYS